MGEIKYIWKSIRVPETDYDGCYDCIHAHDSEDVCRVRGCVHAIGQIKDYYKRATKTYEERTGTQERVSPCDVCIHYPPSFEDGKLCCVCPAERRR